MASTTGKTFLRGVRDGAPFLLVVAPFAVLFGVVATEAGLNLAQVMGFSVLVIAGASQFAAIQLMVDNAPTIVVLATALAVNLRMAMYSAALVPHLGSLPLPVRALAAYFLVDQSYAASILEYERRPEMSVTEKATYFFGVLTPVCPMWYVFTWVGAVAGEAIPKAFALDFAVPITFLALVAPMLKSVAHVAAATTSVAAALALGWMPAGAGLIVAAAAAMAVGAGVETWTERRAA
jgi:predicted branched-subunit amino acid permease